MHHRRVLLTLEGLLLLFSDTNSIIIAVKTAGRRGAQRDVQRRWADLCWQRSLELDCRALFSDCSRSLMVFSTFSTIFCR